MRSTRQAGWALLAAGAVTLAGCGFGGAGQVSLSDVTLDPVQADGSQSALISGLLARPSVLGEGAFAQVADAVMAANTRAAEAELRAARLRSVAAQRNWLPTLGPRVTLSDLGTLAAQMLVEQTLFDNGRKRAERAAARADVEVAAVTLAQEGNQRVADALALYIKAERADALARVDAQAMEKMEDFVYIMGERVRGGVNDRSDLEVVTARLSQIRSDLAADRAEAASLRAQLATMTARPLAGASGLSAIAAVPATADPLSVLKAEAVAARTRAQAVVARAGFLPGVSVGATITEDGVDGAVTAAAPNGVGFGTGASLAALEAAEQAADARIIEAREDATRQILALQGDLSGLQRRNADARSIAAQAAQSYDTYAEQLEAGRRTVPDVISVFETKLRTEKAAVVLRYDIALAQIRIAALKGVLVEGREL